MGGSSLAPEVFRRSSPPAAGALAPARARLDRAAPGAGGRATRSTSRTTLFIVSSKSGGTIEPNALLAYFRDLQPDPAPLRRDHRPGHVDVPSSATDEGFRHVFVSDPEIGGRYSALSPFGIVPAALAGVDVRAVLEGAPGGGRELRAAGGQLGPVARRRARRARPARARQADVRRRPAARLVRAVGGAARRRVDRQAGPRHPADRRRAARRRRRPTATTACSCTCATPTRPTRATPRRSRRSRPPGTRRSRCTAAGVERPRAGCSSSPSSPPPWPAGRSGSTRSTSPTCRRPRTTRPRCSRRARRQDLEDGALAALLDGLAPPGVRRDHGLPALRRRDRRGGRRGCARTLIERARRGDHVGLRAALPALHRPVPQGRPADRALPPARPRRERRPRRCRASRTRSAR